MTPPRRPAKTPPVPPPATHPATDAPSIDAPLNVDTTQPQSDTQVPRLPHERDESVDMTHGAPSTAMQQAHADLERGLQDTDARGASGRPLNQEATTPQPPARDT